MVSYRKLFVTIAMSCMHFMLALPAAVIDFAVSAFSRFDEPVSAAVDRIVAIGHSLKGRPTNNGKAFAGYASGCHGFVSMRRALDASA